jgi:hypothetical protein
MVEISLENEKQEKKEYPKYLLERTLTTGEVTDVTSWAGTKEKKKKDGSKLEVKAEKIILTVLVQPDKIIQCWMNADVKKGSEAKYNTLSYTNLNKLGLLDNFKEELGKAKTNNIPVDLLFIEAYFKNKFKGKKIKFVPETVPADDGKDYSTVKTIEGFA